jgi:hypothetical protein
MLSVFIVCCAAMHVYRAGRNFGRTFGSNMASQAMYANLERLGAQVGPQHMPPKADVAHSDLLVLSNSD